MQILEGSFIIVHVGERNLTRMVRFELGMKFWGVGSSLLNSDPKDEISLSYIGQAHG